ncbi:type I toxin-antitoxin system Hok family toxin [Serratia symbiotica]|nr:Hok/Gef family protein [Serratia symbiotica]USS95777.1 type I toxin-antitoxin system Hok family toxin [Serratia symbiotica]
MKQQMAILIATTVVAAAIAVTLVTRKDLCEVRIRTGQAEVAVFMDYEPK